MANVYEGQPDGRQSDEPIAVSRFRPKYRALTNEEKALHDAIKAKAAEMEALFEQARRLRFPGSEIDPTAYEYFGFGMNSLELSVMWTVKGLTS